MKRKTLDWLTSPSLLILLGAILAATGGFWANKQSERKDRERDSLTIEFQKKLDEKNQKIIEKTEEVARLSQTVADFLSGGNSFCYVLLSNINDGQIANQGGYLTVLHSGKFPLYEVQIRTVDLKNMPSNAKTLEELTKNDIILNFPTLTPNLNSIQGTIHFDNKTELRYNIFITSRSGIFTQLLRYKKINSKWVYATVVKKTIAYKDSTKEVVIYNKIEKGYPVNKSGKVVWNQ